MCSNFFIRSGGPKISFCSMIRSNAPNSVLLGPTTPDKKGRSLANLNQSIIEEEPTSVLRVCASISENQGKAIFRGVSWMMVFSNKGLRSAVFLVSKAAWLHKWRKKVVTKHQPLLRFTAPHAHVYRAHDFFHCLRFRQNHLYWLGINFTKRLWLWMTPHVGLSMAMHSWPFFNASKSRHTAPSLTCLAEDGTCKYRLDPQHCCRPWPSIELGTGLSNFRAIELSLSLASVHATQQEACISLLAGIMNY